MSNLVKVDPKEYGLEEKQASEITKGLSTILEERNLLVESYMEVIDLDITEENIPTFKSLRLQIVKNRTQGLKVWHKTNKAYFLAGGNFVQAIYNKEVAENERMEAQLMEAEKHFENLEKERLEKLTLERVEICLPYVEDSSLIAPDLGALSQSLWDNYLIGLKTSYEARIAEEEKLKKECEEKQRINNLRDKRDLELRPYYQFVPEQHADLGTLSGEEWTDFFAEMQNAKSNYDNEQERIRNENERLRKERETELKRQESERKRLEKEHADKIEERRLKAIQFLFDNGFGNSHGGMEIAIYSYFIGANHYSQLESDKEYDLFCSETLKSIETSKAELEKKEALKKLKEKEEAEAESTRKAEEARQVELSKGDMEKVKDLIADLAKLKTKYSFESAKNKKMYEDVGSLIDEIIHHIE